MSIKVVIQRLFIRCLKGLVNDHWAVQSIYWFEASKTGICYLKLTPTNKCINSLWPSDAIRRQGTESTLAQVMACCLMAPAFVKKRLSKASSTIAWVNNALTLVVENGNMFDHQGCVQRLNRPKKTTEMFDFEIENQQCKEKVDYWV